MNTNKLADEVSAEIFRELRNEAHKERTRPGIDPGGYMVAFIVGMAFMIIILLAMIVK